MKADNKTRTEPPPHGPAAPRLIAVSVQPKASRDSVEEDGAGGYRVRTTAPADKGQANDAVARLLARHLNVAPSCVLLRRGATSRKKLFEIV